TLSRASRTSVEPDWLRSRSTDSTRTAGLSSCAAASRRRWMLGAFMLPVTTLRWVSSREMATPPELSGCTERTVEYTSSLGEVTELSSVPAPDGAPVGIRRAPKNPMAIRASAPMGCRRRAMPLDGAPLDMLLNDAAQASRKSRHGRFTAHRAPGAPP